MEADKNRMLCADDAKAFVSLTEFIKKYARHTPDCEIRRTGKCDCGFFEERASLPKGAYLTR